MAEENEEIKVEKKSSPITKIILFGVPAFIIQLILVYFITANILINKVSSGTHTEHGEETVSEEASGEHGGDSEEGEGSHSSGQFIYSIDEVVINPANTNGRQLLLTALAFDLHSEENKTELEGKEFLVKDMIISVLSSKSARFLNDISQRDSLKNEISNKIEGFIPDVKINKVYFTKFILQ
jgi:flagellar FliL protein